MIGSATQRPIAFALSLGLLGGAALITVEWTTKRGPLVLIPYAVLILVSAFYLRGERVQHWPRRFALSLGAFMSATLILYLFIGSVATRNLFAISLWGHAWRLGLMLAIGAALSAAVAQLTATKPTA